VTALTDDDLNKTINKKWRNGRYSYVTYEKGMTFEAAELLLVNHAKLKHWAIGITVALLAIVATMTSK